VVLSNAMRSNEIILAKNMVDETDWSIMVKVAKELRESQGNEASNTCKVRQVTTKSIARKSKTNPIATISENESVLSSDTTIHVLYTIN